MCRSVLPARATEALSNFGRFGAALSYGGTCSHLQKTMVHPTRIRLHVYVSGIIFSKDNVMSLLKIVKNDNVRHNFGRLSL